MRLDRFSLHAHVYVHITVLVIVCIHPQRGVPHMLKWLRARVRLVCTSKEVLATINVVYVAAKVFRFHLHAHVLYLSLIVQIICVHPRKWGFYKHEKVIE